MTKSEKVLEAALIPLPVVGRVDSMDGLREEAR